MTETILNKTPAKSADLGEETLKAIEARCEAAMRGSWEVAREDLPRLLTAYRALKAENERLREVCTAWDRFAPYLAAHGQIAISDAPSAVTEKEEV